MAADITTVCVSGGRLTERLREVTGEGDAGDLPEVTELLAGLTEVLDVADGGDGGYRSVKVD